MAAAIVDRLNSETATETEFGLGVYRKMLAVFYVEERMKVFARQGKCSFLASTRGHELVQSAMALLLKPGHDWFFTYYRSKATAIALGVPLQNIFLGMLGRAGDPNSGGRNMPERLPSSLWVCVSSRFLA